MIQSLNVKRSNLLLVAGIYSYCIGSTPWPQKIGVGEVASGFFLACYMIVSCLELRKKSRRDSEPYYILKYTLVYIFIFLVLAIIPLIATLSVDFSLSSFLRDALPLAFLILLPCAINSVINNNLSSNASSINKYVFLFVYVALPATILSFRALNETGFQIAGLGINQFHLDSQYKQYDSLVLFTLISSLPLSINLLLKNKFLLAAAYFISFTFCAISVAAVTLRLPLFITSVISTAYFFGSIFSSNLLLKGAVNRKSLLSFCIFLSLVIIVISLPQAKVVLINIFNLLIKKNEVAGSSAKMSELKEILQIANESWIGLGFGTLYYNDTNNIFVRFTHSIVTYPLLKAGYLGLLITIIYVGNVFFTIKSNISSALKQVSNSEFEKIILLSLLGLIVISFFQVIYKPLSFPLLIGLVIGLSFKPVNQYNLQKALYK